jgi:two-component system sensor histidine kinase KdpD
MSFSPHRVDRLVEEALESSKVATADHPVASRIDGQLPRVEADPVWVEKLLVNLIENAAKYSPKGEPIFVSAEQRGSLVAISVADRGYGIEPLEQSLIFDKFYRARNRSQATSGTGMGLAICRAIAETHGGTIGVTSQLGRGSVFTFTLRVAG